LGNLSTSYDHDIEINLLKLKLDRFAENVSTKLDDLAFEINHIKENKPYPIVILEDQINELKKEKLELRRINDDHQKRIINMSCTISDLKSTNRNLEDEKSSLLTAIRLIQSDYSQLGIKAAVIEVENEDPATWKASKQNTRSKPASPQTIAYRRGRWL
jgi:chromosome segregation ATPase